MNNILDLIVQEQSAADSAIFRWLGTIEPELQPLIRAAVVPARRIRPALLSLLVGYEIQPKIQEATSNLGISVELLHRASLIVDDIIDADTVRRGAPTFHVRFGLDRALLVPHLIVAEALGMMVSAPSLQQSAIAAYRRMSIGQIADIRPDLSQKSFVDYYYSNVLGKTRPPFELVFQTAAMLCDANGMRFRAGGSVKSVAMLVGELFQMTNDFYDAQPHLNRLRIEKPITVVNLDLLTAVALDHTPTLRTAFFDLIGKQVSRSRFDDFYAHVRTDTTLKICRNIIQKHQATLRTQFALVPRAWRNILDPLCAWLDSEECWGSQETYEAGYERTATKAVA